LQNVLSLNMPYPIHYYSFSIEYDLYGICLLVRKMGKLAVKSQGKAHNSRT